MDTDVITVTEAAELTGKPKTVIRWAIRNGYLTAKLYGSDSRRGVYLIRRVDLDHYTANPPQIGRRKFKQD